MKIEEMIEAWISLFRKQLTKAEGDAYCRIMNRWNLKAEQLQELFDQVLLKCKYFPRPQEICEIKNELFPAVAERFEGEVWEPVLDASGETTCVRYTREYLDWAKVHKKKTKSIRGTAATLILGFQKLTRLPMTCPRAVGPKAPTRSRH